MRTIHKYKLAVAQHQMIQMPKISMPINLELQDGMPKLWCMVDTESEMRDVGIIVVGTGQPIPEKAKNYLGSVIVGLYVWHYFSEVTL